MNSIITILLALVAVAAQAQEIKSQCNAIADTYWKNEATGDWHIGFAPKHVIYNNKVWEITAQKEKDDSYMLKLDNGTVVKVGKLNNGLRSITICKNSIFSTNPQLLRKLFKIAHNIKHQRDKQMITQNV